MNTKDILNSYQEKKAKKRRFLIIFSFFVLLFITINVVLTFLLFPLKQKSVSMAPDIPNDAIVMATPIVTKVNRGDVVVMNPIHKVESSFFKKAGSIFTSFFTGQQVFLSEKNAVPGTKQKIRRIVAMPGDTIYMRDYVLYVKPKGEKHFLTEFEISKQPYNVTFYAPPANWDSSLCAKGSFNQITLGDDQYFVLADNRKASDDSRLWGPISKSDLDGKVLFCYFPFDKVKFF